LDKFEILRGMGGVYNVSTRNLNNEKRIRICVENYDFYSIEEFFSAMLSINELQFEN
jgi:hypothetical protein